MPIKIQSELPAYEELISENIFVMTMDRASTQNIRPIRIAILNLMPTKIETETQLLRLLGNSPLQVDIELMQVASHVHKNTPQEHLTNFYKTFSELKDEYFDGMIITGAPVESFLSRRLIIGKNFVILWNGRKPMFLVHFIYVGVHRQGFIITTVYQSMNLMRSFLAFISIRLQKFFILL